MAEVLNANSKCKELCPKYNLCTKMVDTGLGHLLIAGSHSSMAEFEAEDGSLISSAEYFGTADMTPDEVETHREAGEALRKGGSGLQKALLEGCTEDGPRMLGQDSDGNEKYLCQSTNRSVVEFTEEDLKY